MTARAESGFPRDISAATLAALAGAVLAGCVPPHPHHHEGGGPLREISSLDCPSSMGDLDLKTRAGDGSACAYASADGDDRVDLALMKVSAADATAALAPIEAELKTNLPDAFTVGAKSGPSIPEGAGDRVNIDLPGLHIHSAGDGHASVDTAGVHVTAAGAPGDEEHGEAHVAVGGSAHDGVTVDAHRGGAQIRVDEAGPGVRIAYLLEAERPGPAGWRLAAYEARGPAAGPIVVAKILSRRAHADDLRHEVRDLMRTNVGG